MNTPCHGPELKNALLVERPIRPTFFQPRCAGASPAGPAHRGRVGAKVFHEHDQQARVPRGLSVVEEAEAASAERRWGPEGGDRLRRRRGGRRQALAEAADPDDGRRIPNAPACRPMNRRRRMLGFGRESFNLRRNPFDFWPNPNGSRRNSFDFWQNPNGSRRNPLDLRRGSMGFWLRSMGLARRTAGWVKKGTNFEWRRSFRVESH